MVWKKTTNFHKSRTKDYENPMISQDGVLDISPSHYCNTNNAGCVSSSYAPKGRQESSISLGGC